MAEKAQKRMTVAEFMEWDDGTDTRYELNGGVLVAMAPPSPRHGAIVVNAAAVISQRLEPRPPCHAQSEAGIVVNELTRWQADLAMTCEEAQASGNVEAPRLIVEVLSVSTRTHDLGRKLPDYKDIAAVEEIWLIDSERRWVQLWRRDGQRWIVQDFVGGSSFESGVLGGAIALDRLYRATGL